MPVFQRILERITAHRAHPIAEVSGSALIAELNRKFSEVEWALQAQCEALRDLEDSKERLTDGGA